ncbi:WLM domain-containing protein, partial [Entophlyctis helioformis]
RAAFSRTCPQFTTSMPLTLAVSFKGVQHLVALANDGDDGNNDGNGNGNHNDDEGKPIRLPMPADMTLLDLKHGLAQSLPSVDVLPKSMRLVLRGKTLGPDSGLVSELLAHAALPAPHGHSHGDGHDESQSQGAQQQKQPQKQPQKQQQPPIKLMLLGSSAASIQSIHAADAKHAAASAAYRHAAASAGRHTPTRIVAAASSLSSSTSSAAAAGDLTPPPTPYTCHALAPLPHFPADSVAAARAMLHRVRSDWGIRHIMAKHGWTVATLAEIDPTADAAILGYNRNRGEVIALRLRTDDYGGFRDFASVRRVMVHELTHMVVSEHDDAFYELCRRLEREVDAVNRGQRTGSERVASFGGSGGSAGFGEHVLEGGAFVLGGGKRGGGGQGEGASSPSREVLAQAAMQRLTREEQEITGGCASGHSHKHADGRADGRADGHTAQQ